MIALSHSRLSDYLQCPLKFQAKYLAKTYPDESQKECFVRGNRIHKACEAAIKTIKSGQEFVHPDAKLKSVQNALPVIKAVVGAYQRVDAEEQVSINQNFERVDWFSKATMYRAIFDVVAVNPTEAMMIDWKTGKYAPYSGYGGQLHLSSMVLLSIHPTIERVRCVYMYLDQKKKDELVINRSELAQLQGYFQDQFELVNKAEAFEPKVNQYCHWCLLTPDQCKYASPNK